MHMNAQAQWPVAATSVAAAAAGHWLAAQIRRQDGTRWVFQREKGAGSIISLESVLFAPHDTMLRHTDIPGNHVMRVDLGGGGR
jgi:hypothetical protein